VALTLFAVTVASCLCGALVAQQRLPGMSTLAGAVLIAITLIWLLLKVSAYALPNKQPS
jgi:hypothetical protein